MSIHTTEDPGYRAQTVVSAVKTTIWRKQITEESERLKAWSQQEQTEEEELHIQVEGSRVLRSRGTAAGPLWLWGAAWALSQKAGGGQHTENSSV